MGDERARDREIQPSPRTHQVEPDGAGRKYMFLPGEISEVRAAEKSAEAVVAMTPAERREERRAEASRKDSTPGLAEGALGLPSGRAVR